MQAYLLRLQAEVRASVRRGEAMQDAAADAKRDDPDSWALFDEFHPRNVTTAFHEIEWE